MAVGACARSSPASERLYLLSRFLRQVRRSRAWTGSCWSQWDEFSGWGPSGGVGSDCGCERGYGVGQGAGNSGLLYFWNHNGAFPGPSLARGEMEACGAAAEGPSGCNFWCPWHLLLLEPTGPLEYKPQVFIAYTAAWHWAALMPHLRLYVGSFCPSAAE